MRNCPEHQVHACLFERDGNSLEQRIQKKEIEEFRLVLHAAKIANQFPSI